MQNFSMENWINFFIKIWRKKKWWKIYLNTQAGIFIFQVANTINVASQTVIQALQFHLLCNATMASWTVHNTQSDTYSVFSPMSEHTREWFLKRTKNNKNIPKKENINQSVFFFYWNFEHIWWLTYLNGLCGRGFGVDVDFGTVGVWERPVCFVFEAIFKKRFLIGWEHKLKI